VSQPYLSLVVAARNDDHGGNFLERMQAFIDGWVAQTRIHQIPSELLIVEWNPPADRKRLADALRWPPDSGSCEVRIIMVPPEVHFRYGHSSVLPLYQMIAKNVGIRRARGRFVLVTNIDILFSTELAAFLSKQELQKGKMYRIDRYDVMNSLPAGLSNEEQLAWCRTHLIRVNTRQGTFQVTADGSPALSAADIARPESGIRFLDGFLPPERSIARQVYRWATASAEVRLGRSPRRGVPLMIDLEPGPALQGGPLDLRIRADSGTVLLNERIDRRTRVPLTLPDPLPEKLWLETGEGGSAIGSDPRVLTMRVFELDWESGSLSKGVSLGSRVGYYWRAFQLVIAKLAEDRPVVTLNFRVPPMVRTWSKRYLAWGGLTGMVFRGVPFWFRSLLSSRSKPEPEPYAAVHAVPGTVGTPPFHLHTNGCGDFTLMAREHWFELRGYPEFDSFSMNLDGLLCFAAHYGGAREEMLLDPMRIYHLEHAKGSGWTIEGEKSLFERLAAKGIYVIPNDLVLKWGSEMRKLNAPMIFNREDWGLARFDLEEMVVRGVLW
jgi:hypothetical protein